ncbi:phage major capsid protein [Kitasatospora sp. NPDC088346]|uniref:phage major capsid family protein n=1 Tax=Kitasatospora sp. NPDC088346 TaxID=3364073 RepID=UPI00382CC53C
MTLRVDELSAYLAARSKALRELAKLESRGIHSDAEKARETDLLAEIKRADDVMRTAVTDAVMIEDQRTNQAVWARSTDSYANRPRGSVRIFDTSLSQTRDGDWFDAVTSQYAPVTLSAAGKGSRLIQKVAAFPFSRQRGFLPIAPKATAVLQARNEAAAFIANQVTAPAFEAVKVSAMVSIDKDTLTDIPPTEAALNTTLAAAIGARLDHVLIQGGTDGDVTVTGMLADGKTTAVPEIGFDQLADAVARIEDSGGTAEAIIARPSEIAGIRKKVDGNKLDKLPELISIPDLADGTPGIPTGTVIVADLASVAVAIRKSLEILKTENSPEAFRVDRVFIAGRCRVSSVVLADAARVQILKVG